MEEQKENVVVEEKTDFDSKVDSFYTDKDKEVPEEGSASKDDQSEETEESLDTGDDQSKTPEKSKEETETKDSKDPRDLMFRKGYNEAKAKLEPIVKEYEGVKGQLEEFKKVTSSPDYIRWSMKQQGYKDETIDAKLTEMGHKVQPKQENGLDLVLNRLGVDINTLDDAGKNYINTQVADMVKVFDVLFHDRYSKVSSNDLAPLKETMQSVAQEKSASEILEKMSSVVEQEGILDFEKDLLPAVDKFMDENPKASQREIFDHFKELNHNLYTERVKLGTKKVNRDDSKKNLRSQREGTVMSLEGIKKTGNFDKDADNFFSARGIKD